MDITQKIASYLEEAGEEPKISCDTLNQYNIPYVVLRNVWGNNNICKTNDAACQKLRSMLRSGGLSVVSIHSDIGDIPASQLMNINNDKINRAFDIAAYYDAESIRIGIGYKDRDDCYNIINEWMDKISDLSIKNNISPLLEIVDNTHIREPAIIAKLLSQHMKWRILYDPVQLIIKRKINPFIKYWSLLKSRVDAIDVRDYSVGRGFKMPGYGDSKIIDTITDAKNSNFKGWFFLEPNIGRKYGTATNKSETFALVIENLRDII